MTRFFLRRPVTTWMIFASFVVMAIYAVPKIEVEAIPELDLPSLTQDTDRTQLALDGVSCTFCHSLQPDPAQVPSTFSGAWVLGTPGLLFGPHANPLAAPITNFHLPKSSLLALVGSYGGPDRVMDAYRHAVESGYRFYSYGDAMLIEPEVS